MRGRTRAVMRGGAGASGASIIVHDVMLCLLIAMMIISLSESAARLVAIAAMMILVASVVTAFVGIVAIIAIALVMATMMIMLVTTIIGATTIPVAAMHLAVLVTFA